MTATAEKTKPGLWQRIKNAVTRGAKGGKPGQWSARKAQLATSEYKHAGGGYRGEKSADNHLQQWSDEDWGTRSGGESLETGERYLPKEAREALSAEEYGRTTRKKRRDLRAGKQHSAQPADIAKKTAGARDRAAGSDKTKAELMAEAKKRDIAGRSTMTKAELERALRKH